MIDKKNKNRPELAVLVHGYNKSSEDMSFLADGLKKSGYRILIVDLPTTFGSLEKCSDILAETLSSMEFLKYTIHFIGHSFGGLIIRYYLSQYTISNIGRCVLIATPNNGTVLSDIINNNLSPIIAVLKPLKSLTTGAVEIEPPKNIPCPDFGIIAGTSNELFLGKLFLSKTSDGRVEVQSTKFDLMKDFIDLPYDHKNIHFQSETVKLVHYFLFHGRFPK